MALFAALEIESKVQVKDKTRLSALKCYKTPDALPIVNVSVTPGATGSAIALTPIGSPTAVAQEQDLWYTDFEWASWTFDVDSTNNKIDIEVGGSLYVATLTPATYTTEALLMAEIETALNASGSGLTFTMSIDELKRLTFSADGAFKLLPYTGVNRLNGLLKHIGFEDSLDTDSSTEVSGLPIEYGLRKITLDIDDDDVVPVTSQSVMYQKVYTELGDNLLSADFDLQKHEEDILKWVGPGRNTFKDVHRRVLDLILEYLAGEGYLSGDRKKLTKWDLVVKKDLRDWATYFALYLIFEGNSNAVDDIFGQKAVRYYTLMVKSRSRYISVDLDADGKADSDENLRLGTINLYQR